MALTSGLIVAACSTHAASQTGSAAFGGLYHQAWGVREGAPGTIIAIAQSADGYLWLATGDGLARFDGVRFERVQLPGAPAATVTGLWALDDGRVWTALGSTGLFERLANGQVVGHDARNGLPAGTVLSLDQHPDGAVWTAGTGGVARLQGGRWTSVGLESRLPKGDADGLAIDRSGAVWVTVAGRLHRRAGGAAHFEAIPTDAGVRGFALTADGAIVAALADGRIGRIDANGDTTASPAVEGSVRQVKASRSGGLWIAGQGGLTRATPAATSRGAPLSIATFTARDGLSGDEAFAVFEDREGNVWAGTSGGLDLFRETALTPAPLPTTLHGIRLAATDDGSLWIASQSHPLMRLHHGQVSAISVPPRGSSVHAGQNGRVWTFSDHALWRVDGIRAVRLAAAPRPDLDAWSLAEDRAGRVWVAFLTGEVYRFEHGHWTPADLAGVPAGAGRIRVAVTDDAGRVWFGYSGNAVVMIDGDRARAFDERDGLHVRGVSGIAANHRRTWVVGRDGLGVIDRDRVRMIPGFDAESVGRLSGVAEAADGSLWLNGGRGVVRVAPDEVERMLGTGEAPSHLRVFDYLDGVIGGAALVPPQTAMATRDGRLWFVGFDRVVTIDPRQVPTNALSPPVHVRSVRAGDRVYEAGDQLSLPVGTTQIQIRYTALSLAMPDRVRFRYQLRGVDATPQDAGTRREAFYTNLAPGHYTFHVSASNNDGVWNDTGATLALVVPPAFYQTTSFRAAAMVGALALGWVTYRLRVRQLTADLHARLDARLSERERIARELHDTLLQGFQGLILRFQAVANRMPPGEPAARMMEEALGLADRVLVEGRDRVKDLRRSADEGADLADALAAAGRELRGPEGSDCRVIVEGQPRRLHPVVRDEAYWIAREAMANAVRHAGAGRIEVEVGYLPDSLRVRCRDDGRGIEPALLEQGGRLEHWGLQGMRERAQRAGGTLAIWSRPAAGTEVELRVASRLAYEEQSPGWFVRVIRAARGGGRWTRSMHESES